MTYAVQLGNIIQLRKGKKAAEVHEERVNGTKPYIQIDEVRGAAPQKYAYDAKGVTVTPADLCIVWDGANAGTVGYGVDGLIGSTVARMRIKTPDEWDTEFVGRLLQSRFRQLNDEAQARGATIPHVDKSKLEAIELPRIGRSEQRRIAFILAWADGIRRKRERLIGEAQHFVRSAYLHTVGHLNPSHGDWEPVTIEALAEDRKGAIRSGPFGSALRHGEFVDEGIAVLGIDNAVQNKFAWAGRRFITPSKYEELRRYRVFPGDVIITIMGTTGRSAVVPDDIPEAITTKHLATITCNKELIHPEVLSFAIHSDPLIIRQIKSFNKGAIMDGLNLGIIRKLEINLPPMEEQLRFVRMLRKARAIEMRSQTSEGSGEDLFQSLSQRAFRGEL
jgi:type I restriction enzyme S subunit